MGPLTLVSLGKNAADELARRRARLVPSTVPCNFSLLISRIHFSLFSDWRRAVSSKLFDTPAPSVFTERVLSRLRCNGHSLLLAPISLGLVESRFFHAVPTAIRPRILFISFCTVQLRTLCATLCPSTSSGLGPGELPSF